MNIYTFLTVMAIILTVVCTYKSRGSFEVEKETIIGVSIAYLIAFGAMGGVISHIFYSNYNLKDFAKYVKVYSIELDNKTKSTEIAKEISNLLSNNKSVLSYKVEHTEISKDKIYEIQVTATVGNKYFYYEEEITYKVLYIDGEVYIEDKLLNHQIEAIKSTVKGDTTNSEIESNQAIN